MTTFVSSASAKADFREWTDQLLALLADADARTGAPRIKAMAAALGMLDGRPAATKPGKPTAKVENYGWDKIVAAALIDTGRVRSVTPDDRP